MAPADDDNGSVRQRELQGWKEIADYLNRSVRTAQRWEREFDLPVKRLRSAAGETVYAVTQELDTWKERFSRRDGLSGGPDEGDDRVSGQPMGPSDDAGPPPDEAAGRHSSFGARSPRRQTLAVAATATLVLALGAIGIGLWSRAGVRRDAAADSEASAAVLDPGPWPTGGHDMQRTNRSHLRGPRRAAAPSAIYTMRGNYVQPTDPIITMDGHLLLGWCGEVVGLDLDGHEEWKRPLLAVNGVPAHPGGFAASSGGSIYFTGADCLDVRDLIETRLYNTTSAGTAGWQEREIGSSYSAPAIGPDRSIYTLDEVTYLRAFRPWMDAAWGTTLGGFTGFGIAVDGKGNLYVATDGGVTHEWSLWAVDTHGEIRWQRLKEAATQPVVGAGLVYVLTLKGMVHAYTFDGDLQWSRYVGPISTHQPLALGASGTLYAQTARDLVALNPDGTIKWRAGNGACATHMHPVVDQDESIYVALGDFIVSFTPGGKERWRVPLARPMAIVLGDRRRLYVVTGENTLCAIDEQ